MTVEVSLVFTAFWLFFLSGDRQIDLICSHKRGTDSQDHSRKINPETDTQPGAEHIAAGKAHQNRHGQRQAQLGQEGQLRKYLIPFHGACLPLPRSLSPFVYTLPAGRVLQQYMGYCNIIAEKTRLQRHLLFHADIRACLFGFIISKHFFRKHDQQHSRFKKNSSLADTNPAKNTQKHFIVVSHLKEFLFSNLTRFTSERQVTKTAELCSHSVPLPDYTPGRVYKNKAHSLSKTLFYRKTNDPDTVSSSGSSAVYLYSLETLITSAAGLFNL